MKILGLDLGTNSIGWAVIEKDGNNITLTNKGVRIFQEGVKIEKGIEGSKAAERTGYRSARRLKYRRKLRKIETLIALGKFGFCPLLSSEELADWRYKRVYPKSESFRNWLLTDEKENKSPYFYRNLAVTQHLDLSIQNNRLIIGRAFYHIAQRRGFLSNRLEATKESEGAVKKSIAEISEAKGDKTLGQYFYKKYKNREKIRDVYTHREEHYLDEFNSICEFQNLPQDFIDELRKAIFFQRPLKSQKGLVGKCVFENNKPRCPVSRPEYEEYRMLCFINNIKVQSPDDDKMRFLNSTEKDKIRPAFFRKSKEYFSFEDIAKLIAPKKQYKFYRERNIHPEDWLFNYSMKTTVSGCPVSARFMELFGENFMETEFPYVRQKDNIASKIDIYDIWHVLFTFDSDKRLANFASMKLGFNEDRKKLFLKIRLKQDYASLSLKAIRKILPYLREGLIYSHAVFLANMSSIIPKEVWKEKVNRDLINTAILGIIQSQNEEKSIADIINGVIKQSKEDGNAWSVEAAELYERELEHKVVTYFGVNKFNSFSEGKKERITSAAKSLFVTQMKRNMGLGEFVKVKRIDERVKDFVSDNFDVKETKLNNLYHPSAIDVYSPPQRGENGHLYLGSPLVSSIKNPMAMRSLHQLRKVINELIKCEIIDASTRIHIEMARGLLNSNERKALQSWQRDNESRRAGYILKIKEHFGEDYLPSDEEIFKYQFWEEQTHKCLYTGREIGIEDFLGANPKYDIEHTIPRSLSFDNSQINKTLCESAFNRSVKKNGIPYELANHTEILERLKSWKEKIEGLEKQIEVAVRQSNGAPDKDTKDRAIQKRHRLKFELDYWRNKYRRFTMKDVPDGFKNSQLVDTGIITRYARMYLNTLFDKVYTVKGSTVSDFRQMWGLQGNYQKKARINHIHHCIDAITIACITKDSYEKLASFYHEWEELHLKGVDHLPYIEKPWATFAEDVKQVENEVLVSHYTPDVLPKQSKRKLRKRGKIQYNENGSIIYQQGDTVRGSLHKDTFYGAIEREVINKKGEMEKVIKYVCRKALDTLEDSHVKNIVDDKVREIVIEARIKEKELKKELEGLKRSLQKAEEWEESEILKQIESLEKQIMDLYTLPNKKGDPVPIKKVRVFQPSVTNPLNIKKQRDKSVQNPKPYKEDYHVANDGNYLMGIYEGKDANGKIKRNFEIINNLEAGEFFKYSVQSVLRAQELGGMEHLIPSVKMSGKLELQLKAILKTGTMVILWEKNPEEVWEINNSDLVCRLYKVVGLSVNRVKSGNKYYEFGNIVLRHHQEASPASGLKTYDGEYSIDEEYIPQRKLSHNQFNAVVQGVDFTLSSLGKIVSI